MDEKYTVVITDVGGKVVKVVGIFTEQKTAMNWSQRESIIHRQWIYETVKFEWAY